LLTMYVNVNWPGLRFLKYFRRKIW
jgi:hypothetical protein